MLAITIDQDLHLELFNRRQAATLFALVDSNREHLRQWLPWVDGTTQVEHSREFIEQTRRDFAAERSMAFGIWFGRRHLAGVIGFHNINAMHRSLEIGYWLGTEWEGRGIMTRAVRALIEYAITHLNTHRVVIRVATSNTKSRAIPERLGFTHEGRAREAEWLYDHFVDHEVYSLLASEISFEGVP